MEWELFSNGRISVNQITDTVKNGEFYFKDTGIQTIMSTVARWYIVNIRYEGQVHDKKYTLRVPLGADLSAITDSLKKQGAHLIKHGKTITISN